MSSRHITQLILLIACCMLTASCATIYTRKSYNLKITSGTANARIKYRDSTYVLPAILRVRRSKHDLPLLLITDSATKRFTVKAAPNPAFVYGNLIWMEVAPAAYLIDLTSQKRFFYGKSLRLDMDDTQTVIRPRLSERPRKVRTLNKGDALLSVSVPFVNNFVQRPAGEGVKDQSGFWGLSAGLDYVYKANRYLSLSVGIAGDFPVPVPAAIDRLGTYETMSAMYADISSHYRLKRFTLGYGLAYTHNVWAVQFIGGDSLIMPVRAPVEKSSNTLGLLLSVYYPLGRHFCAGVAYRPALLSFTPDTRFAYQHVISLDFAWKLKLNGRRSR